MFLAALRVSIRKTNPAADDLTPPTRCEPRADGPAVRGLSESHFQLLSDLKTAPPPPLAPFLYQKKKENLPVIRLT